MAKIEKFTDLHVWRLAHQLALDVYRATDGMPSAERFGLTSQMRRAAVSVSANIVEGFRRHGRNDQARFYNIASASLDELTAELLLAGDLSYLSGENKDSLIDGADHLARCLTIFTQKHRQLM